MEILLLLVCAIGVVTFLVFAFGFISLLDTAQVETLTKEQEQRRKEADDLQSRNQKLLDLLKDLERTPTPSGQENRHQLEKEFSDVRAKHEKLSAQYDNLLRQIALLAEEIKYSNRSSLANKLDTVALRIELQKLRSKLEMLTIDVKELENKAKYKGVSDQKRVLNVEVQRDGCRFYPESVTVELTRATSAGYLREHTEDIDLIIFWIRPEGIDTYNRVLKEVSKLGIPTSHEPLLQGQSLETTLQEF